MRVRARLRVGSLPSGTTIISVNFNSADCAETLVEAVRRFSPPDVRVVIVDNGSHEPLPASLARSRQVDVVRVKRNVGHGAGMDLGVLRVRTTHFVAMDIDAFPICEGWLDMWLRPLDQGARVSGARLYIKDDGSHYVHPCCLAMRLDTFVRGRHTFSPGVVKGWWCDTGEQISVREPAQHYIDVTEQRGPGAVGSVFGNAVYHNFYATRFVGRDDPVLDDVVTETDARLAWDEAVSRFLRS